MSGTRRIAFLFIGGVHHVYHTMPVACALASREEIQVTAFAADAAIESKVREVAADCSGAAVAVERLVAHRG